MNATFLVTSPENDLISSNSVLIKDCRKKNEHRQYFLLLLNKMRCPGGGLNVPADSLTKLDLRESEEPSGGPVQVQVLVSSFFVIRFRWEWVSKSVCHCFVLVSFVSKRAGMPAMKRMCTETGAVYYVFAYQGEVSCCRPHPLYLPSRNVVSRWEHARAESLFL